jgi:hypothetical protein
MTAGWPGCPACCCLSARWPDLLWSHGVVLDILGRRLHSQLCFACPTTAAKPLQRVCGGDVLWVYPWDFDPRGYLQLEDEGLSGWCVCQSVCSFVLSGWRCCPLCSVCTRAPAARLVRVVQVPHACSCMCRTMLWSHPDVGTHGLPSGVVPPAQHAVHLSPEHPGT